MVRSRFQPARTPRPAPGKAEGQGPATTDDLFSVLRGLRQAALANGLRVGAEQERAVGGYAHKADSQADSGPCPGELARGHE